MRSLLRFAPVTVISLALLLALDSGSAQADEAVVLPKGVFQLRTDVNFYFDFEDRWDKDGNLVGYGAGLNRNLNFGPGGTSFGRSSGTVTRELNEIFIQGAYGLTNRLSIGFILPYFYMTNRVSVAVDGSAATGGAQLGFTPAGAPCVGPGTPGCNPSTVSNINALLQAQFGMTDLAGGRSWRSDRWRALSILYIRAIQGGVHGRRKVSYRKARRSGRCHQHQSGFRYLCPALSISE